MLKLFLTSRKWLASLFAVNLVGFMIGLSYYTYQLSVTPGWLWVFVIDCPLYVLLFGIICLRRLKNLEIPSWLHYLTSVGLIKYGFWTGLVIWLHFDYFFGFAPLVYALLFPLHIGMILEGIALIPWIKNNPWHIPPVLGWFLLNDWLDYFQGTLPLIPETHHTFLMWESILATLILTGAIYLITRKGGKHGKS